LAARTSSADVRGAMYCLIFMAGRRNKAMACVGEMAGINWSRGRRGRADMAPITARKLMLLGELALSRRQSWHTLAFHPAPPIASRHLGAPEKNIFETRG
jgi:hypothetical protein